MSVAMTVDAVQARIKTVTRRANWQQANVGDRIVLCKKIQGRKPGERLVVVEITNMRREPLHAITDAELVLEGCSHMTTGEFIDMVIDGNKQHRLTSRSLVTRIEFVYVEEQPNDRPTGIAPADSLPANRSLQLNRR